MSFVSLEYIEAYQEDWRYDRSLIVLPEVGRKDELDAWLESEMAGEQRLVRTYKEELAWWQDAVDTLLYTVSLMESVVALVGALALVGLNYVFIARRQSEMGVLNALGLSRGQLVWRTVRETLFTTSAAWLVGVVGCAVLLLYFQQALYAPAGLRIEFLDPTPWFFTLPVPAAVICVSAAAVGRALSRLDPVAVIERR